MPIRFSTTPNDAEKLYSMRFILMSSDTSNAQFLEDLRSFACESLPKAIAAYTYIISMMDRNLYFNVFDTLQFLGLSENEIKKIYEDLAMKFREKTIPFSESVNVVRYCLEKLDVINEARKRIETLSEEDKKILQAAAVGILKRSFKVLDLIDMFNSIDVAMLVSEMLSKNVDHEYLEKLLVRTLLAVRCHVESRRKYYYHIMSLIPVPDVIKIFKELA